MNQEENLVHLEEIHRFRNADGTANKEEAAASLALREAPVVGKDDPWAYYRAQGKIKAGDTQHMADQVFAAWQNDTNDGHTSLMLAGTNAQVDALNKKAQAYRLHHGHLDDTRSMMARHHVEIYVGDVILTKSNDRRLSVHQGKDFVKNNDAWIVEGIEGNHLLARHQQHHGLAVIPASYVEENVILGYADTVHTAQGATVDTAHALLTSGTDRAGAYVATSRGKYDNRIYVGLAEGERPDEVLRGIAERTDLNITAHESISREFEKARDIDSLGEIYRDLVDQARNAKYERIFRNVVGNEAAEQFIADPAWGAIVHHLKDAEDKRLKLESLLEDAYSRREFTDAQNQAAVLAWRIQPLVENREATLTEAYRPLREVSDEHLAELKQRALAQSADAGTPCRQTAIDLAKTEGILAHTRRLYGHLTEDELTGRITRTDDELLRQFPSDPENQEAYLSWSLGKLKEEQQLRQNMPEQLHQAEIRDRDHKLLAATSGTVLERISTELKLRELERPAITQPRERNQLGEWYAPREQLADPWLPVAWKEQITAYRHVVDTEHQRLGAELAQNPPAWLESLGPVPGRSDRAEEWRRLAAEVAAYRRTYNIPDSEPGLLPKSHLKNSTVAQELRNRAAALHKHSALTSTPPLDPQAKRAHVTMISDQASTTLSPTSAESKLAELRQRVQGQQKAAKNQEDRVSTESEQKTSAQEPELGAKSLLSRLRKNRLEQETQKDQIREDETRHNGPQGPTLR